MPSILKNGPLFNFVRSFEAAKAKAEYERHVKTFKNIDHSHQEPPNNFIEMNIIPKLLYLYFIVNYVNKN